LVSDTLHRLKNFLLSIFNFVFKNYIIISVDGNIGCGKSKLIESIEKNIENIILIPEPISIWLHNKDSNGHALIESFNNDKNRWAYTLQQFTYITRVRMLSDAINKAINQKYTVWDQLKLWVMGKKIHILTERSVLSDRYVFTKMLHDQGYINNLEMKLYLTWYSYFINKFKISKIIYVSTNPEICKNRNVNNNQGSCDITYLNLVHKYYDDWIGKIKDEYVLKIINDKECSDENMKEQLESIKHFIPK